MARKGQIGTGITVQMVAEGFIIDTTEESGQGRNRILLTMPVMNTLQKWIETELSLTVQKGPTP